MAETKKEKNKLIDAVTRMIELTQRGEMQWRAMIPRGYASKLASRTTSVFQTFYNGRRLQIYRVNVEEVIHPNFMMPRPSSGLGETVLVPRTTLEFVDEQGETLWTFPYTSASEDLLTAVQYQVADVNDFIDNLLNESNVPQ